MFPARQAVSFHFVDYVVHSWDVARTLDLPLRLDSDLLDAALTVAGAVPGGNARLEPGAAFAPGVAWSGGSRIDQIVAFLGRSPDWRAGFVPRRRGQGELSDAARPAAGSTVGIWRDRGYSLAMSIAITEEHRALAQTVAGFLTKHQSRAAARALLEAETEPLPAFWAELARPRPARAAHPGRARRLGLRAGGDAGRGRAAGPAPGPGPVRPDRDRQRRAGRAGARRPAQARCCPAWPTAA